MGIVLAGLGWYVWHARKDLAIITRFDLRYLAPMLLVPLSALWVNGRVGREVAGEFGVRLGGLEAYALAAVHSLGNYLPVPQAGALARGVYLKRVHDLPYSTYAATVVVTYVSAIALYGLVGLIALAALAVTGRPAPWQLWLIFLALAGSIVLFTPAAAELPLPKRLTGFRDGLLRLSRHHVLGKIVLLQLALISLTSTGLWLACLALPGGQDVTWFVGLMMGLMVLASGIANVTPGNLGVEQAAAMFTGQLLGVRPEIGFLASSLYRVMSVVVVFGVGPVLAHWLTRQENRSAKELVRGRPAGSVEPPQDARPAGDAPAAIRERAEVG
jgi:uncharacterized membrane protein YbhN (UPF0104 family)